MVELNTAPASKGDPGAQTEATQRVKQSTSRPKPHMPVIKLNG